MNLPQPSPEELAARAAQNAFRPHGRTMMWAQGALVHVVAEGPFNREGIDAFSNEMVALYRRLPAQRRFVNITEVRGTLLATPDAWQRLAEHVQAIKDSPLPLVATAWVVGPEVEGRSLFLPRARQLFATAGRLFEAFETLEPAEEWAQRQLPLV